MTTENQLRRSMERINTVAKKVLDAVPMQEAWTREQIVGELRRAGSNVGVNVIHGCLENLRGNGLITEPASGRFTRVCAKPRVHLVPPSPPVITEEPMAATNPSPTTETDPVLQIAGIASRFRALADELDDAALSVQQHIDSIRGDSEKLKQLQSLLKGIA